MVQLGRALIALAVLSACCGPLLTYARGSLAGVKPTAHGAPSKVPGVLRLALTDAAPMVDPAFVGDDQNVQLAGLLYSGLVRLDSSYRVVPDAATRYTVSRDRRTYTFSLRRDLKFSNGDPLTARDFEFSIKRSLSSSLKSASAAAYLIDIQGADAVLAGKAKSVSGLKVLDAYTLQITTRYPAPYFPLELTYPTSFALDSKHIAKLGITDDSWYTNPIGSGPYRLKSWTPNQQMVLVPNKYYPQTRPSLKEVTVSLSPLPASGLYGYVNHNLDVVSLPSNDGSLLHRQGIQQTNMLAIDGIYMNFKVKPFGNVKVRRALTLALDRHTLVPRAMAQTVTPFGGSVPPGESGYDPQLKPLPYDVSAARQALKAAGFAGGKGFPSVTLYYADDPARSRLAQVCARAWKKYLNISVDTQPLTVNTLLAKVESNSLAFYLSGWSAIYPDAHDWLTLQWRSDVANNDVHYHSKKFDRLVETADVTWDPVQRSRLFNEAQQTLVSDAAWIPLYIPHRVVYIRPGVTNLILTGYGLIPRSGNWAQVGIEPPSTKRHHAF